MTAFTREATLLANGGGNSQRVSISGTSAQSAMITGGSCVLYSTVDCFIRAGDNPTAVSDGTDQFIPAGSMLRVVGIDPGWKLAFKTAGPAGYVYITPGV